MSFVTPLRYPGGKGRLGPWLAQTLRANKLSGGTYVEPYAGGAGAAILLLTQGYVDRIVINDVDPAIHAFWWLVLRDTKNFVQRIRRCRVTMTRWEHHRAVLEAPEKYSREDLGFAAFFLNRTNRSGILSGGVIGGKNQKGNYSLDARFNKVELAGRIERIGSLRDHIDLHRMDAMKLLRRLDGNLPKKSLIYLDPPYFVKGSQLYRNFYNPDDHQAIADQVQSLKSPWLVTYDNCSEVRGMYKDSSSLKFSLRYSTHLARPQATEVMFFGNLQIESKPFLRR